MEFSWWEGVKIYFAKRDFMSACRAFNKMSEKGIGTSLLGSDGFCIGLYTSKPKEVKALSEWINSTGFFQESDDDQ